MDRDWDGLSLLRNRRLGLPCVKVAGRLEHWRTAASSADARMELMLGCRMVWQARGQEVRYGYSKLTPKCQAEVAASSTMNREFTLNSNVLACAMDTTRKAFALCIIHSSTIYACYSFDYVSRR